MYMNEINCSCIKAGTKLTKFHIFMNWSIEEIVPLSSDTVNLLQHGFVQCQKIIVNNYLLNTESSVILSVVVM
jgi:hypothetical protein